jgi:hypothetical protein
MHTQFVQRERERESPRDAHGSNSSMMVMERVAKIEKNVAPLSQAIGIYRR